MSYKHPFFVSPGCLGEPKKLLPLTLQSVNTRPRLHPSDTPNQNDSRASRVKKQETRGTPARWGQYQQPMFKASRIWLSAAQLQTAAPKRSWKVEFKETFILIQNSFEIYIFCFIKYISHGHLKDPSYLIFFTTCPQAACLIYFCYVTNHPETLWIMRICPPPYNWYLGPGNSLLWGAILHPWDI